MARPFGPFVPSGNGTGCQCSAPSVDRYSAPSPALPMLPSLRTSRDHYVERPIRSLRQPPGERLFLRDPIVLQATNVRPPSELL